MSKINPARKVLLKKIIMSFRSPAPVHKILAMDASIIFLMPDCALGLDLAPICCRFPGPDQ